MAILPKVLIPVRAPNGDFHILEVQPPDLDWPELRALWQKEKVKRPLCFAPPEQRLDLFFSYACQKAGVPISLGTVFNPGWTDMFLGKINHDCLVISSELVRYLDERRLFANRLGQLRQIVIVGDTRQDAPGSEPARTAQAGCHTLCHPARPLMP